MTTTTTESSEWLNQLNDDELRSFQDSLSDDFHFRDDRTLSDTSFDLDSFMADEMFAHTFDPSENSNDIGPAGLVTQQDDMDRHIFSGMDHTGTLTPSESVQQRPCTCHCQQHATHPATQARSNNVATSSFTSNASYGSIILCKDPGSIPPGRRARKDLMCGVPGCPSLKLFDRKYELERHMATHRQGAFVCQVEGCRWRMRGFRRQEHLRNHEWSKHGILAGGSARR